MKVRSVMVVAGETSGDLLAAELVEALRPHFDGQTFPPRWFGAGGPALEAAGIEIVEEMTREAVVGLGDVLRSLGRYRRIFHRLLRVAGERLPELVVLVDFTGFNRRFARALRERAGRGNPAFRNWRPRIVQYVSPQVWASRPGRAGRMAPDLDLLLCLFPFEKTWYEQRVPELRVECVGHPLCDRHPDRWRAVTSGGTVEETVAGDEPPLVLLLPGSRPAEVRRHLPVMIGAIEQIRQARPIRVTAVLPSAHLFELARETVRATTGNAGEPLELRVGGLAGALAGARVALASTGTVTLECALFGVPTVALYKTSWLTYQIARRLVTVERMAMPNLLAGGSVYPEFIQADATPDNLARATLDLLGNAAHRREMRVSLEAVVRQLGGPGASRRAAAHIVQLLGGEPGAVHPAAGGLARRSDRG